LTDKILFFFGGAFYNLGIAKYLHENHDCKIFAISDVETESKKFFLQQNFVQFKKIWFFRDHIAIGTKRKPDINYLTSFEEKYGINLWMISYSERKFYKFNPFYTYNSDEILSILEQECKLYENILDEVKPDFLIMGLYDQQHLYLLYDLCQAKKIPVLMLLPVRFGNRTRIAEDEKRFDAIEHEINANTLDSTRSISDLQNYLKRNELLKQVNEFKKGLKKISTFEKCKSLLEFMLFNDSSTFNNSFSAYGNTRLKILYKKPIKLIRKRRTRSFVNKKFLKNIDKKIPFVYFPLHSEPERSIAISAPFYTNQIEVITSIAKSLPVEYKLFVKEHPAMDLKEGRPISFYKELMKLPNVELLHPTVDKDEILSNCSLVITINGTSGFEGAFFNKPSITFVETDYSSLPFVHTLKNIEELPKAIRNSLRTKVNFSDLDKFVKSMEKNTFEYNGISLVNDFYSRFYNMGIVVPSKKIPLKEMETFLEDHKSTFEKVGMEYLKQIKHYKQYESQQKLES